MKNTLTIVAALALLYSCGTAPQVEAAQEVAPLASTCTQEAAYDRAIAGIRDRFKGDNRVSAYYYSADAVDTTNADYDYWVTTQVVVDGQTRYNVEAGLQCLGTTLGLGWLDLQPSTK